MKKLLFILAILLLIVPIVSAQKSGSMKLLAVQTIGNETESGSVADLTLEVRPGSGRVFLDTFPFTKLDTQISTRFANRVACVYFELDCSKYDFIYTLKSSSTIIGWPSAGAAMAALTIIVMEDLPNDHSVAITGTINSGGIIGPVGGYEEKIEAAADTGLITVLVAEGARFQTDEGNQTIDLKNDGAELGIHVVEVDDLNDVVYYFSGVRLVDDHNDFVVTDEYTSLMQKVSGVLCKRRESLYDQLNAFPLNMSERNHLGNFTRKADNALGEGNYYSAASFCFGGNIAAKKTLFEKKQLSDEEIVERVSDLRERIRNFSATIKNMTFNSINDLQTYAIVAERLGDAQESLDGSDAEHQVDSLAYAEERFFSALSWAEFFRLSDNKDLVIDSAVLARSCQQKIQEASELYQYIHLYTPQLTSYIATELEGAEHLLQEKDFALCLMRASQAKADASALLTSLSIEQDDFPALIDKKLAATERSISRTSKREIFPILGYSYYEYSKSLRNITPVSALLYSEYALELSNLDIYFEDEPVSPFLGVDIVKSKILVAFIGGAIVGALLVLIIMLIKKPSDAAPKHNIRGKKR